MYGEDIQIWSTSSWTDDLGNSVKEWDVDKGTVKGIVTHPINAAGRFTAADKKVIIPADTVITTDDRVEVEDITYECMGEYAEWVVRKRNIIHHLEILLKKVGT